MTPEVIEGLIVFCACIGLGVTLLVVEADRLPPLLQSWAKARYRKPLAVGVILLGAIGSVSTIVTGG